MSAHNALIEAIIDDLSSIGIACNSTVAFELTKRCSSKDAAINEYFRDASMYDAIYQRSLVSNGRSGGGSADENNKSDKNKELKFKVGDYVKLSSKFASCMDAAEGCLAGALKYGDDVGEIVERNSRNNPYRVKSARGKLWWYMEEALVLAPDQVLATLTGDMGFPDNELTRKAAKMFKTANEARDYIVFEMLPPEAKMHRQLLKMGEIDDEITKRAASMHNNVANAVEYIAFERLPPTEKLHKQLLLLGFPDDKTTKRASVCCSSIEAAVQYISSNDGKPDNLSLIECQSGCGDSYPSDEIVTLDCNHKHCKLCFSMYCEVQINENAIDEKSFKCPQYDAATKSYCNCPITPFEVKEHCSREIYEKYNKFLNRRLFEGAMGLLRCPSCNEWYIEMGHMDEHNEADWKNLQCQNCSHVFCAKCGERPHKGQKDQNITCEEFHEWRRQNDQAVQAFEKFMAENGVKKCPVCSNAVERKSGCLFLYCTCKGTLCAICGVELDESQHHAHFNNKPFGTECKGPLDVTKNPKPKI